MSRARSPLKNNSAAQIGFEAKLWLAADKLRSNANLDINALEITETLKQPWLNSPKSPPI